MDDPFATTLRRTLVAVLALGALLVAPTAAHAALTDQTLSLDTHSAGAAGSGGAVSTDDVLESNKLYAIVVSGTFSKWTAASWVRRCGIPEPQPATPSPGVTNGRVGLDAETIFAFKRDNGQACPKLPFHQPVFQMRLAPGPFKHPEPFGGAKTSPSPDHSYNYGVKGLGIAASFKITDRPVSDNYGVLKIRVRLATAEDCANGYPTFGFANQQDCEAYFASGSNAVVNGDQGGGGLNTIGGNFVISHNNVKVRPNGVLRLRVSCRSPLPCRGKISLRSLSRLPGSPRSKKLPIGLPITFDIPPKSRHLLLRFHLRQKTRRLVDGVRLTRVQGVARVHLGQPSKALKATARFNLYGEHSRRRVVD